MKNNASVQLKYSALTAKSTLTRKSKFAVCISRFAYRDLNNKRRSCKQADEVGFESELQVLKIRALYRKIHNLPAVQRLIS